MENLLPVDIPVRRGLNDRRADERAAESGFNDRFHIAVMLLVFGTELCVILYPIPAERQRFVAGSVDRRHGCLT